MDVVKFQLAKGATSSLVEVLSTWFIDKPDYTAYMQILQSISDAATIDDLNNCLADAWNLFDDETISEVKK